MDSQPLKRRYLLVTILSGVLASLATGLVENSPEFSVIGYRYYGYPLVWRVTKTLQPAEFKLVNLLIDVLFWTAVAFSALILLEVALPRLGTKADYKAVFLSLVLFIPVGLITDVIHELGHAIWGISVGGRLTYLKVAFLEVYPRLALTSDFQLGLVKIEGLTTEFAYGLMLLGGSLTTNIASWLLALVLLRMNLGYKTRLGLRIMGVLGLLDLPFYVILPQIGLRHWVFLGGKTPEPLIGARKMGIPDPVFYAAVILVTLGLAFLYFKPFWERCWKSIKSSELWIFKVIPGLIFFSLWLDGSFFPVNSASHTLCSPR